MIRNHHPKHLRWVLKRPPFYNCAVRPWQKTICRYNKLTLEVTPNATASERSSCKTQNDLLSSFCNWTEDSGVTISNWISSTFNRASGGDRKIRLPSTVRSWELMDVLRPDEAQFFRCFFVCLSTGRTLGTTYENIINQGSVKKVKYRIGFLDSS